MTEFEHRIEFKPGFNYRDDPEKKEYGIHGMSCRFLCVGPMGVTQFMWNTGLVPRMGSIIGGYTVPAGTIYASDFGYHWPTPRYPDQSAYDCDLLPDGKCYYDGSGVRAGELMHEFVDQGPDAVWSALEAEYERLAAETAVAS